jgi:selenium metabolism protein YedF
MAQIIDAKGLSCPQPVILAKKALEVCDEIIVLVDNKTACDNVQRFAAKSGCVVNVIRESEASFRLEIKKTAASAVINESGAISGETVFVISSEVMGSGNDELGAILMKAFIHTTAELDTLPATMIFYNTGAKLAVSDSDVIDDLKALETKGVRIMVCGTCANFFNIADRLGAGSISNMYDIAAALTTAGRIVRP